MNITNDTITFDDADFSGLSDLAKKAVPSYFGTTPMTEHFGNELTNHIRTAKEILKRTTATADTRIDGILAGLASADAAKLAEVEPFLVDLQNALK